VLDMMIGPCRPARTVQKDLLARIGREKGAAEGVEARQPADARSDVRTGASRRARDPCAAAATGPRACARLRWLLRIRCRKQDDSAPRPAPKPVAAARSYRVGRTGRGLAQAHY
jgi:hypothetical protein